MLSKTLSPLMLGLLVFAMSGFADSDLHKTHQFDPFERVYFTGNAQLYLVQGSATGTNEINSATVHSATVSGPPHSLEYLVFESADGVLYIDAGDRQAVEDLVIHLNVSQLNEVVSGGNGQVFSDGLILQSLAVEGHGAGLFDLQGLRVEDLVVVGEDKTLIQVSGSAEHQYVDLAGVGRYQAQNLSSRTGQVSVRDSGRVDIRVEELLDVNVFGAAKVRYTGTPWVSQKIFGSGAIDHGKLADDKNCNDRRVTNNIHLVWKSPGTYRG